MATYSRLTIVLMVWGLLIGAILHPEAGWGSVAPADHAILLNASTSSGGHPSPEGDHDVHLNHPQAASVPARSGGDAAQVAVEPVPPSVSPVLVPSPVAAAVPVRPQDRSGRQRLLDLDVWRI
ncbi:hypothetical protein FNH05_02465 [Amycolatopsis rhizosphaerae]|uniref:Uncharacterized protein n=1 Tax=Amycolatopsis rhizosphaerae TaxID=2053003 RepID=A0A558DKU8_9PSEU|nr:hypothetical protein [Amycolatopsis rhizosphaerae]TVT61645.1 hypothetical protein FNH05_02465 [Amycolatopsis rhizosphaerae]